MVIFELLAVGALCKRFEITPIDTILKRGDLKLELREGENIYLEAESPQVYRMDIFNNTIAQSSQFSDYGRVSSCNVYQRRLQAVNTTLSAVDLSSVQAHIRLQNLIIILSEGNKLFTFNLNVMLHKEVNILAEVNISRDDKAFLFRGHKRNQIILLSSSSSAVVAFSEQGKVVNFKRVELSPKSYFGIQNETTLEFTLLLTNGSLIRYRLGEDLTVNHTLLGQLLVTGDAQLKDFEFQKINDEYYLYVIQEDLLWICPFSNLAKCISTYVKGMFFNSIAVEGNIIFVSGGVPLVRDFTIQLYYDANATRVKMNRVFLNERWVQDTQIYEDFMLEVGTQRVNVYWAGEFEPTFTNEFSSVYMGGRIHFADIIGVERLKDNSVFINLFAILDNYVVLRRMQVVPMRAVCKGDSHDFRMKVVQNQPFCPEKQVDSFLARQDRMTRCITFVNYNIQYISHIREDLLLLVKLGMVALFAIVLLATCINYRAKMKALEEFEIETESVDQNNSSVIGASMEIANN